MESANFHHQQQQQQQQEEDRPLVADSSSSAASSCYGLAWSQNPILNGSNNMNSRDLMPCLNDNNINSNIVQDMGFPWSNSNINGTNNPVDNFMTQELQRLARVKDELSVSAESYPKFTELINSCSPSSSIEDLHLHPSPRYNNQDMLLTNFSAGCQIKSGHGQLLNQFASPGELISYSNANNNQSQTVPRGTFSQIFPTINISSLNQSSGAISSSSLDMNLPALDLFGSPAYNGSFSHPSSLNAHHLGGLFKDTCLSYGLDQMHQTNHRPTACPSKMSSAFPSGSTEAKRPSNYMDSKATQSTAPKKSKLESRPSCSPFKVRKEKLGDRIAALQQLVAPFGKTDTASVLMEAIGYIKFLQNQVETLSVPYMKATQKASRTTSRGGSMEDGKEEAKRDLKSRGLCLVPLSCLSYVADGGGGIWPAP